MLVLLALLACAPAPDPEPASVAPDPAIAEAVAHKEALVAASGARAAGEPYNVVLVISDALRAADLPLYGYPRSTSPNLDALAAESLVFEHAVSHFPGTPVSVSQLFTGRYAPPLLMGARLFAIPTRQVPAELPTLPRALKAAGYRTGLVSSHYWWTDDSRLLPMLDQVQVVEPESGSYAPFEQLLPPVEGFLDQAGDQPFFLIVHSLDTHAPWRDLDADLAGPGWSEEQARYDTDIRRTDRGVKALIDALEARGQWDRTVFVFTSDHGEEFGELGPESWNRHHGIQVRRPLTEIPLLVRIPGGPTGRVAAPVGLVDLAPTLVPLAAPGATLSPVDGRDLHAHWLSGTPSKADQILFATSGRFHAAILPERELIVDPWAGTAELFAIDRDANNYPRLIPADEPRLRAELAAAQGAHQQASKLGYDRLPLLDGVADGAQIHVPWATTSNSPTTPIFADDPTDGRWSHPGRALRLHPTETAPALELVQPWAPGTYTVTLDLDNQDPDWNRDFTLAIDGGPAIRPTLDATGHKATFGPVTTTGPQMTLTVTPGSGGVGIRALGFHRVDGSDPGDPDLPEKLKAIGYQ